MNLAIPNKFRPSAEVLFVEAIALATAALLFGLFLLVVDKNPFDVYGQMALGSFGSGFAWENSLTRAAPMMLTALCTALPARLGMVIIGNEAALLVGGLAAVGVARVLQPMEGSAVLVLMMLGAALVGGGWIALSALLRQFRGVNETISSLLLYYVGLGLFLWLVEGPMRDPSSLNKPSTFPIGDGNTLGTLPGMDVHWGLGFGIVACLLCYVLMDHTVFGFGARVAGGNLRAAQVAGLDVTRLILITALLGGAAAGIAGAIEIAAVHQAANATLNAGMGFAGILVAFVARQNPLAIIPVAVLMGGIEASGGMLQRHSGLPDATVDVFKGIIFVCILGCESLIGRIRALQPEVVSHG